MCVSPGCGNPAACNPAGPGFPLSDTGQQQCGNATNFVACSGSPGTFARESTPFCGQDAQYGWDTTHLDTERYTISRAVASEPLVTDHVTGLMWRRS